MIRRSLKRVLWTIAAIGLVYAYVTTFVMQVRYVDSGSMEPTIFGSESNGEWVLVHLDRSVPERYDIVVIQSPNNGLLVKRVWGLPGEKFRVLAGDVYIEDELLPQGDSRPKPITVFDDRWHNLADYFVTQDTVWTQESDSWLVSATGVEPQSKAGMIFLHKKIQDSYLDSAHRTIQGTQVVNDLVASVELRFEEWNADGAFRIDLREGGDSFEALIEPVDENTAKVSLIRTTDETIDEVMNEANLSFTTREWNAVEFANVDNVLTLTIRTAKGEEESVTSSYEANTLGDPPPRQVQFAATRARLRVRSVRLARDLYFTRHGKHAVDAPMVIGADQIMVLGDNSGRSRDGREFGPVSLDQLYGRATRVVWPFSSWRTLESE